jgi:hypothetical protein
MVDGIKNSFPQNDYKVLQYLQHLSETIDINLLLGGLTVGRKQNNNQLEEIYKTVDQNPGQRSGFIARILGIPRSQVTRALPAMQERGHLMSEDEKGRLWVFKRRK